LNPEQELIIMVVKLIKKQVVCGKKPATQTVTGPGPK